jgi:hypothetical protein
LSWDYIYAWVFASVLIYYNSIHCIHFCSNFVVFIVSAPHVSWTFCGRWLYVFLS